MATTWTRYVLWIAAFSCLFAGLYVAADHTFQILKSFNYLLGSLDDQSHDAARVIYPVLNGEQPWWHLFDRFNDHRVVVERLIFIYDFFVHQGIEVAHPYRFAFVNWLTVILFLGLVYKIQSIPSYAKVLISGCTLSFLFSGIHMMNYRTTILFTWPLIMLFSLLVFIFTNYYCAALQKNKLFSAKIYLFLTALFVILAIYTFNIGLILWPIVFLILYKQSNFKPYRYVWWFFAVFSYISYFIHWASSTGRGIKHLLLTPWVPFLYFTRLVSIPFLPNAQFATSLLTIMIGISIGSFCLFYLKKLWTKKNWSSIETILFGYFAFNFLAILIIAMMRSWLESEITAVSLRFMTPLFMLLLCLLVSIFMFNVRDYSKTNIFLSGMVALYLLFWFIPHNKGPYEASTLNPYFIALSLQPSVSINFIEATKNWNPLGRKEDIFYNEKIQKKFHQGVYSLWAAQKIQHQLPLFADAGNCPAQLQITEDLRQKNNGIIFLQANFDNSIMPTTNWKMLMTNSSGEIIGFGLPITINGSLWEHLFARNTFSQSWQGAVNTDFLSNNKVIVQFVDLQRKKMCKAGEINILSSHGLSVGSIHNKNGSHGQAMG